MDEQVAGGHFQLAVQPVSVADEHDAHGQGSSLASVSHCGSSSAFLTLAL
jgi:hypothetical protein